MLGTSPSSAGYRTGLISRCLAASRAGAVLLAVALAAVAPLRAQPGDGTTPAPGPAPGEAAPAAPHVASTGSITGRVLNQRNGKYLDKAVVQVVGGNAQALTDESGQYLLYDLPPGQVQVKVSYTGLAPVLAQVTVIPGTTTNQDFNFNPSSKFAANGAVMLDEFVVEQEKETNAQEIAINEQREATNLKTVVAADSFGHIMNGNVADFVKYLPGITVDYGSEISVYGNNADAQRISLRGVPSNLVPITIAGMPVADASANLSRSYEMDQLSINNASRVEVIEQPTPDLPFNSPAGVINIVPKSAFEYATRRLTFNVFDNFNNEDPNFFNKEPGPHNKSTYHAMPGFDASYVVPLTKNFGFTFSILSSNQYNIGAGSRTDWTYTGAASLSTPDLYRVRFVDSPRDAFRESASVSFDWKPSSIITTSLAYSASTNTGYNINRNMDFNKLAPTGGLASNFGPDFVNAKTTAVTNNADFQETSGYGQHLSTLGKLRSGPWQVDWAGSFSQSSSHLNSGKDGYVSDYSDNLNGVTAVNASGIRGASVGSITALNSSGAPIDFTQAANFKLPSSINIGSSASRDVFEAVKLDARRDFDFIPFRWMNLAAKTGVYFTREERSQYGVGESPRYDLVTANEPSAITATTFLDTVNSGYQHHFAAGGDQQWLDPYLLYQYYVANPTVYTLNLPASYQTYVNNNKVVTENKGQYYFMFDSSFIHNRLRVVAGLRGEKDEGTGLVPYTEPNNVYQHNPDGSYTTVNGTRVLIPNLTTLQEYQLIYQPLVYQATHTSAKPSDSVNLAFDITANLKALVNYSKTYGPQNYNSLTTGSGGGIPNINQLAPGVVNADGSIGTISITNPNLPPEISSNWDYALAYYNDSGGQLKVNYYRKTISNYTYTTTTLITPQNAAALSSPGLTFEPSGYVNFDLAENASDPNTTIHQTGWEFSVQQNLKFIPVYGKYFTFFGNYTTKSQSGIPVNADASTPNSIASTDAGGVTFANRLFTMRLLTTQTALNTTGHTTIIVAGAPVTYYTGIPATRRYDTNFEYRFSRHYYLFANALNVFNAHQKVIVFGPGIPTYALPTSNFDYGVQINVGISGAF